MDSTSISSISLLSLFLDGLLRIWNRTRTHSSILLFISLFLFLFLFHSLSLPLFFSLILSYRFYSIAFFFSYGWYFFFDATIYNNHYYLILLLAFLFSITDTFKAFSFSSSSSFPSTSNNHPSSLNQHEGDDFFLFLFFLFSLCSLLESLPLPIAFLSPLFLCWRCQTQQRLASRRAFERTTRKRSSLPSSLFFLSLSDLAIFAISAITIH
jgi:hypothetical protein